MRGVAAAAFSTLPGPLTSISDVNRLGNWRAIGRGCCADSDHVRMGAVALPHLALHAAFADRHLQVALDGEILDVGLERARLSRAGVSFAGTMPLPSTTSAKCETTSTAAASDSGVRTISSSRM